MHVQILTRPLLSNFQFLLPIALLEDYHHVHHFLQRSDPACLHSLLHPCYPAKKSHRIIVKHHQINQPMNSQMILLVDQSALIRIAVVILVSVVQVSSATISQREELQFQVHLIPDQLSHVDHLPLLVNRLVLIHLHLVVWPISQAFTSVPTRQGCTEVELEMLVTQTHRWSMDSMVVHPVMVDPSSVPDMPLSIFHRAH